MLLHHSDPKQDVPIDISLLPENNKKIREEKEKTTQSRPGFILANRVVRRSVALASRFAPSRD